MARDVSFCAFLVPPTLKAQLAVTFKDGIITNEKHT
jgi:hypothetical protein